MTSTRFWSTPTVRSIVVASVLVATAATVTNSSAESASALMRSVQVGDYPSSVAVDPVTGNVITVNSNDDSLTIVSDVAGAPATTTVKVGRKPYGVAVDPQTHQIFVSNTLDGTLRIVNGDDPLGTLQKVVKVGGSPLGVAIDPANHAVYVANNADGTVSVYDGTPGVVAPVYTETVGADPVGIAVDTSANTLAHHVYVANSGDDTISSFERGIGVTHVISTISVGKHPLRVAVDQGSNTVYVTDNYANTVAQFNGGASKPGVTFQAVGKNPVDVAVDSVTHAVYVTNLGDNTVTEYRGTGAIETMAVGLDPTGVAIDPSTHTVFVASGLENTLSWFDAVSFPTIQPAALPDATQNAAYGFQVTFEGTPAPYFAIISSKTSVAPAGLTIDAVTGLLAGPVTGPPGTYKFLVNADNGTNQSASVEFTLVVNPPSPRPAPSATGAITSPIQASVVGSASGDRAPGKGMHLASTGAGVLSVLPFAVGFIFGGSLLVGVVVSLGNFKRRRAPLRR